MPIGREYATLIYNEATKIHLGNEKHTFEGEKRMYARTLEVRVMCVRWQF